MGFRAILVPIEQHDLMSSTLETAPCLAQKFDSYMEGFALRVAIPAAYAMADAAALTIPKLEHDIAENAKQTRSLFEAFMQKHGVPCGAPTAALSSKWLDGLLQIATMAFLGKWWHRQSRLWIAGLGSPLV